MTDKTKTWDQLLFQVITRELAPKGFKKSQHKNYTVPPVWGSASKKRA